MMYNNDINNNINNKYPKTNLKYYFPLYHSRMLRSTTYTSILVSIVNNTNLHLTSKYNAKRQIENTREMINCFHAYNDDNDTNARNLKKILGYLKGKNTLELGVSLMDNILLNNNKNN